MLAGKATQRLEIQAIQREVSEITVKVEDVVEMMISEVEELGDAGLLSRRSSTSELSRSREDLLAFSRPARVLLDSLAGIRRKVEVFTELSQLLLRNYTDFKQQCEEMSQKVEDLTENFAILQQTEGEAKECRNCKRCLSKITEFNTEIVQLRAELAKTEALLSESRQAKEQLAKELGNLSFRNKELEQEYSKPTLIASETLELQKELKTAEMTISQLETQLKSSFSDADRANSRLEQCEAALRRAQTMIKRLNNESETLAEQLSISENLCDTLKHDAHQSEKLHREAQIQLQSLDCQRKTESRLRDELQSLKCALESVQSDSASEVQHLHSLVSSLTHENQSFQQQIIELENSIVALDGENKQCEAAGKLHEERISDLEQALAGKISEIAAVQREAEMREIEHEGEIAHIKRTAENALRAVQAEGSEERSSPMRQTSPLPNRRVSSVRRTKPDGSQTDREKTPTDRAAYLGQLEEAIVREAGLKAAVLDIVAKASVFLTEKIHNLDCLEGMVRPETERWIMRSEELETMLADLGKRVFPLISLNKDLQKVVKLKNKQLEDQRNWALSVISTSEAAENTLKSELFEVNSTVAEKIMQKGKDVIGLQVDVTMKTVGELRQKAAWLQEHNDHLENEVKDWGERVDRLASDLRVAEEQSASTQADLSLLQSDFVHVQRALSSLQQPYLSSSLSPRDFPAPTVPPSLVAEEIIGDIRSIQQDLALKGQDLTRVEAKMRELIATNRDLQLSFDEDKEALLCELNAIQREKEELEKEVGKLGELVRDVTRQDGEMGELRGAVAELTHERDVLSRENEQIGQRMRQTLEEVKKLEEEMESMKNSHEEMVRELNDARCDLSTFASLKEENEEQNSVISQLRDQLAKSGLRSSESLLTEGSLLRRDLGSTRARSSETSLMAIDRLLTQKEEYIKELEMRLEQGKTDVLGVTSHSSVFEETQLGDSDPSSLRRAKNKITAYKRSFNKRLEEFESVLRLIEDAVTGLASGHVLKLAWPPSSNPTLDSWVDSLLQKIADCAVAASTGRDREVRSLLAALATVMSSDHSSDEDRTAAAGLVNTLQKQAAVDLDYAASQTTALLKRTGDVRKAGRGEDTTVCLSPFHARMLITAIGSLDAVELCLVERKESILQVSEELDGLNRSLAEMPVRSSDLPGKIADMFSKFSVQFLQDLKRDLQAYAEALRDLKDVTRSTPSLTGRLVTLWNFSQQAATRRF